MEREHNRIDPVGTIADGNDNGAITANPADIAQGTDATVAVSETADIDTEANGMPTAPEDTYWPVYNGEVCPIKVADREEITTLLQLGMKQRAFLPVYERLTRLAQDANVPSVQAFVEQLYETKEQEYRDAALSAYGDEQGQRVYELEREQRERRYAALAAKQQTVEQESEQARQQRLRGEFEEIRRDYPQYTDIRKLPASVIAEAAEKRLSLVDAHNRFVLAEQRRAAAERKAQLAAASVTTGSLSAQTPDTVSAEREAFLMGLYSRT